MFCMFFQPFRESSASKSAKSANIWQKRFHNKCQYGYIKNAEFDADFKSVENVATSY
jgi:hypothetical protein